MEREALEMIGFTKNEARIVEKLLVEPEISFRELYKRCGMHRSNFYEAIERLESKGVVSISIAGKEKRVRLNRDAFLSLVAKCREKIARFEKNVRTFLSSQEEGEVVVLRGKEAVDILLPLISSSVNELRIFPTKMRFFNEHFFKHLKALRELRVRKMKRIVYKTPESEEAARKAVEVERNSEYKLVDDEMFNREFVIAVADNRFVIFLFFEPEIKIVYVKSRELARFLHDVFEHFWRLK